MTVNFWQALDRLGSDGAAQLDWRSHLGEDWESCCAYLKATSRVAESVIDPRDPTRRLTVDPDGEDGYVGLSQDEASLLPPVELDVDQIILHKPDWDAITGALAEELNFAANRWETDGCCRKVGTAQEGRDLARPVALCLPPGHLMRQAIILRELSSRKDATILIPSSGCLSPDIHRIAETNGLTIIGLKEHFELGAEGAPAPQIATPITGPAKSKKLGPVFKMQSGWSWEMLTIEVATGGRLIFRCDGQSADVHLPKSNSGNHSESYEILFNLAFAPAQEHELPASWEAQSDTTRKRFTRLKTQLKKLYDVPGDPFTKARNRVYVPRFKLTVHKGLAAHAEEHRKLAG